MTIPVNDYGAPSRSARREKMPIARTTRRVERKRRTPYVRNHGFVPPPLPAYIPNPERLEYLFGKKLRSSDVGKAGRIVLPKRPTEAHLPRLFENQSLYLPVIDMDGGGKWVFKFRYWPNNLSRMYVFEGTGTFTKRYNLQAGDYILVYKDAEDWDYFIRAVKAIEVERAEKDNADPKDDDAAAEGSESAENIDAAVNIVAGENTNATTSAGMACTGSNIENDNFDDLLDSFISWDEYYDSYPPPTPPSGSSDNGSNEDFPRV